MKKFFFALCMVLLALATMSCDDGDKKGDDGASGGSHSGGSHSSGSFAGSSIGGGSSDGSGIDSSESSGELEDAIDNYCGKLDDCLGLGAQCRQSNEVPNDISNECASAITKAYNCIAGLSCSSLENDDAASCQESINKAYQLGCLNHENWGGDDDDDWGDDDDYDWGDGGGSDGGDDGGSDSGSDSGSDWGDYGGGDWGGDW